MLPLPQEYLASLCEIKTMTNELLAVGQIIKIDHKALEIAAKEDKMPLLQFRSVVKIAVHNSKSGSQILAGIVFLSTENFTRIEDVKPLNDFERRGAFRVNVDTPGRLYPVLDDAEQDKLDAELAQMDDAEAASILDAMALEIKVLDISLTGVRIQPNVPLLKNSRYVLEFSPISVPMRFNVIVQRELKSRNDEQQFGCLFYGAKPRLIDKLCKDLFELQRIEKSRRSSGF